MTAQEPPTYDDPFYKQKGSDRVLAERTQSPFQRVQESVDPFTGNLNLLHTDVILPGNGGLDLKIQRSYNGRIWGRKDTSFPGLVAINERSVMGLGWSFHSTQMISREYWIYRQTGISSFQLTLTDGTIYSFSGTNAYQTADGVLICPVGSITTPNGNTISFTYNSTDARLITSVTDTVGRSVTFAYTTLTATGCVGPDLPSPKVRSSISVNGRTYSYSYQITNCNVFLTRATPPVGPAWQYSYRTANPGQFEMASVTYPSGAILSYTYADISFDTGAVSIPFTVVTQRSLSGRGLTSTAWAYGYSANAAANQVTTMTQSGCRTERYTYASFGSLANSGAVNQLWRVGMLLRKEIVGGATTLQTETYTWNQSPSISLDDLGNGDWNGLGGTLYDSEIFVPLLGSKSITRGGKTYTTSYSNYDSYGNPKTITESGDASRTTALTYFYSATKNIVRDHPASESVTVGSETFTTNLGYDPNGNLTSLNRYGVATTFGYTGGNLTSRMNARNYTTTFQYAYGTVSRITNPIYAVTRNVNWTGTIASETDGRANTTYFSYDALNRITSIGPPVEATTTVTYDNAGASYWKVAKGTTFTQYNVDGLGRVADTSASEGINTDTDYNACVQRSYQSYPYTTTNIGDSFTYDALDRITKVTHPDTKTQGYSYSGSNATVTNERGIGVTYHYSAFGNPDEKRLTGVTDATGTTSYTYNTVGSLIRITHVGGGVRNFSYSTKNFLISETHSETGTISYSRDAVGNMTARTDGQGTTAFSYDALDRLTFIDYPGTADDTTLAYDNADNRTRLSSPAAVYAYSFDAANRLTQQVMTVDGRSFTTTYGYDTRGNLTSLTYPTGRLITYSYDTANRVVSLTGYVTSATYHPSGGFASLAYANGKTTTLGYDNRYRVGSIATPGVISYTYGYDGVGNVSSILDGLNAARNRSMAYDGVDRLTSASGVWGSMAFTYGAPGNRASKTVNGATTSYSYSDYRLLSATGAEPDTFTYDASGNISGIRGLSLDCDFANRLTTVNVGAAAYSYDGDGRRVKKVDRSTGRTVIYHYDRAGNILAETDAAGVRLAEYLYINGQHVAKIQP